MMAFVFVLAVALAALVGLPAAAQDIPANADLDFQCGFSTYNRALFIDALFRRMWVTLAEVTILDGSMPVEFYFHGVNKTIYSQQLYYTSQANLELFYNITTLKATVINDRSGSGPGGSSDTGKYVGIIFGVILFCVGFFLFCYFYKPCSDSDKEKSKYSDKELLNTA
jgi:hypothetical protein